ncbi:MAG: PAS domain-containing protein [Desulfobacterales bacterium]|nr:PAS domain-containing protein [Desulfobacterales bacterium]
MDTQTIGTPMDDFSDKYTKEGLLKVIDALPLAISVIDKNRTVALANKSTTRFVNKNEAQLIGLVGGEAFGCAHHDRVPEGCGFGQECMKCKLRETVLDTLENQVPHEMVETTMVFKEHGERHLRISTLPLTLDNDQVVLLSIEDITQAKLLEQTRLEKEKLAAAVETAGAVCHEINQPLMIILGMAEMLLEDLDTEDLETEDESRQANLQQIKEQAERLGKITRKLMTLTEYKTKPYLKKDILDIQNAAEDDDPADTGN